MSNAIYFPGSCAIASIAYSDKATCCHGWLSWNWNAHIKCHNWIQLNQRSDLHVATTSSTNLSLSVLALGMLRWTRLALAWSWANHVLKIACRVKTTKTRVRKTWQNKTVRMKCCSLTKSTHKEQPLKRFHGYTLDVQCECFNPAPCFLLMQDT